MAPKTIARTPEEATADAGPSAADASIGREAAAARFAAGGRARALVRRIALDPWSPVLLAVGVLSIVCGLIATRADLWADLNVYDEGLLLTNAQLMAHGSLPFRDFYTNYPAGIYELLRAWWSVLGVSITAERLLGIAVHVSIAALAGRLTGRLVGRRFSWIGAGMVLLWLAELGIAPHAWLAAVAAALAAIELLCAARGDSRWWRWTIAGVALGAVGGFRYDLLLSLLAVLAVGAALYLLGVRRGRPTRLELRRAGWVSAGALIPLAVVFGPIIVAGATHQMFEDLVVYQFRYVSPARHLPFPPVWHRYPGHFLDLPAFLEGPFQGAVVWTLFAPVLAGVCVLALRRGVLRDRVLLALVAALSVAVIPQMLDRTDGYHAIYTITPALIFAIALVEGLVRRARPAGVALAAAILLVLVLPLHKELPNSKNLANLDIPALNGRLDGVRWDDLGRRLPLVRYIDRHVPPGQPIFVGSHNTAYTRGNDISLYYLADRPPSTRWTQFDPGLITRADIQRQVINGIERHHVRYVVLLDEGINTEPNASTTGPNHSHLLDRWVHQHYHFVKEFGYYSILLVGPPHHGSQRTPRWHTTRGVT